jgi:hypothetical protein
MSPISPTDPTSFVPRREFIRDQRPASSFSILALAGAALLRLYSFSPDVLAALRTRLDEEHLILGSRELIQNNFYEFSLDGKPWSNPKTTRSEKLLIEIIAVLYRKGHNFLSTLDYGREQDDRIVMAFSRPSSMPLLPPQPPSTAPSSNVHMSKDSVVTHSQPVKVPFAISFISQSHLRVIAPPLHLTPAVLQTVRGSWPRGVVSEKKVAENVYEFKLKGYRCNVIPFVNLTDLTHRLPTRVQGSKRIRLQQILFVTFFHYLVPWMVSASPSSLHYHSVVGHALRTYGSSQALSPPNIHLVLLQDRAQIFKRPLPTRFMSVDGVILHQPTRSPLATYRHILGQ